MSNKDSAGSVVRQIRRKTRRKYSAEEKIRIVLEGLRGDGSIAELCRREGISPNLYYKWSKKFLEAGKRRLAGDTKREATSSEVGVLRRENQQLKELDVSRSTFYCWYRRYEEEGYEGLRNKPPTSRRFWNKIPEDEKRVWLKQLWNALK